VAFGYCSNHTNEIGWNAELRHVAKITGRPIGARTRPLWPVAGVLVLAAGLGGADRAA
jgi:hypothetical protein